ncbi:putative lipoprotein [plant metagenome]|uniref:Putative lipoprotein n=1 Tax=plant metagenome TaxID=1297885 RepID=A0A484T6W9_9ZZZZ
MTRSVFLLCLPPLLAGCLATPTGPGWTPPAAASYDFNWRLSGERALAPQQVFHDGQDTWLQFAPGQAVPALFAQSAQGERALPYQSRDPYVLVRGVWPALLMRGGSAVARAQYLGAGQGGGRAPVGRVERDGLPAAGEAHAVPVELPRVDASPAVAPSSVRYDASPAQGTMRAVLRDWSRQAGWTFEPEHWTVAVDIPLAGTASFSEGYEAAVSELLRATELGEQPLQPCFYANRVLRVVSLREACDRTAPVGEGAA